MHAHAYPWITLTSGKQKTTDEVPQFVSIGINGYTFQYNYKPSSTNKKNGGFL
jgi:hypothetical protein